MQCFISHFSTLPYSPDGKDSYRLPHTCIDKTRVAETHLVLHIPLFHLKQGREGQKATEFQSENLMLLEAHLIQSTPPDWPLGEETASSSRPLDRKSPLNQTNLEDAPFPPHFTCVRNCRKREYHLCYTVALTEHCMPLSYLFSSVIPYSSASLWFLSRTYDI